MRKITKCIAFALFFAVVLTVAHFALHIPEVGCAALASGDEAAEAASDTLVYLGEMGKLVVGDDAMTAKNLYVNSLNWTWNCNDWDLLYALQKWAPNSDVQVMSYVVNSTSDEMGDQYSFLVTVDDAFVQNVYIVSFDFWTSREPEGGEYYDCSILENNSETSIKEGTWTSRETDHCYFEFDSRPDEQMGLIGHFYWSMSNTPWETKYDVISFVPVDDDANNQPYAYMVSYNDGNKVYLYPDGTLYNTFYKLIFYPDGMEEQIKGAELTSGNEIGATSSNLFNGGIFAIENDFRVYPVRHSVYRSRLDGSDEMCLYNGSELDQIRSMNLINGECYFTCPGEAAYGYDLNGNMIFHAAGQLDHIVADETTVYYSVFRDSSEAEAGLYAYDKATGNTSKLVNGPVFDIALDGDWVYLVNNYNDTLYRCRKDGSDFGELYDAVLGSFIAEDGVVLFYDKNDKHLHAIITDQDGVIVNGFDVADYTAFGGESAYVGSDITKKIAYRDGYIYYSYPRDNTLICRMSLEGSVVEEYVCTINVSNGGLYLFGNSLYVASWDDVYHITYIMDLPEDDRNWRTDAAVMSDDSIEAFSEEDVSASNDDSNAYSDHYIQDALSYLTAGDMVTFGRFDQDGNPGNGPEPIEWQILSKDASSATLISKYGLDTLPYDREVDSSTWESCVLRRWLNNDFYQQAFSAEEQECLETVNVPADRNPEYNTDPGNMVQDKVYILSIEEANWLLGSDEERMCIPTETALLNGVTPNDSGTCWWWLRSPGGEPNRAGIVDYYGPVFNYGFAVFVEEVTVRPVIVVRL